MARLLNLVLFALATALFWATHANADPPPRGLTAALNGVELYYEEVGTGQPLLLLHGGLGHSGYWHKQIDAFAAHYRVIALDSRGHGRSTFAARPISYALMAGDVVALLDHLKIESSDVVGWSDGGIIGLELAINHRSRVGRVVAFGANYRPDGVRQDIGENSRFNAFIAAAESDYQRYSPAPRRWPEFLENIGRMWASEPNYTDEQMTTITTPMLILAGRNEEAVKIEHIEAMAKLIPNSSLTLLPATGHFALWEKPALFNQTVLEFLGH